MTQTEVAFSGADKAICDCALEYKEKFHLDIYKTDSLSRVTGWNGDGHLTADTVEWITGSNNFDRWGLRYESDCDACLSNEVFWVWSGFKLSEAGIWETNPATSEADRIYYENLNRYAMLFPVSTASIKSPMLLTSRNSKIIIVGIKSGS